MRHEHADKQSFEGTLYLPSGSGGGGFVTIPFGDMEVTAEYTPAKVELLLALNAAWMEDGHLPAAIRGWRDPRQMAPFLEEESVRHSISQINRAFREAADLAGWPDAPRLVTTRRMVGMRLTWLLEIVLRGPLTR